MRKVRYRARRASNGESRVSNITKAVEKRSKTGCLTCRKRKKKCDEIKPICKACKRNFLQCYWADNKSAKEKSPVNIEKVSDPFFSNLSVRSFKDVYSWDLVKHEGISAKTGSNSFIILSSDNSGKLKLAKCGEDSLQLMEFPTVEQLCPTSEDISKIDDLQTKKSSFKQISIDSRSFQLSEKADYESFFDLQWNSIQTLEKSDFALNWFTRYDNAGEISNCIGNSEPRSLSEGIESNYVSASHDEQNRTLLIFDYNYLYDKQDPLALKYNEIMNGFDQGDYSMLHEMSKDEHFLIYSCVERWLPKMGPQDTHPLLTTAATFTSHFERNHIVKEVFLCCGATYLEWFDYKLFSELSNDLYRSSLALIQKYLTENSFHGTEAWLLASYQLLCLRNKTTSSTSVDDCVFCLSNSYHIIKATYYVSADQSNRESHSSIFFHQETPKEVQELRYEIENKVLEIEEQIDNVKKHLILQPHERMFIESFIYNYSVAIMWSSDISQLPNPFTFFKEMNHLLKCPIYHCELEWMNNPILGAASAAFEILAKVSYITRLPMPLPKDSIWIRRCQQLQKMSQFYTSPIIVPRAKTGGNSRTESCLLNIYVGKIIAKVCYLLLCKILRYDTYTIRESQPIVEEIMDILEKIPEKNLMWGILPWPIIVCGIFVIKPVQQLKILRYLNNIGEMLHKLSILNSNFFLKTVWSKLPEDERLNVIFDRKELIEVNP